MTKDWAIVTGASSGIGLEFATIFAHKQVNVALVARNVNALNSLANTLRTKGVKVLVLPLDLSVMEQVKDLVKLLDKKKIIPRYLINNAGFGDFGYFTETKWEKEEKMLDLNIKALTYLTKVYAKVMKTEGRGAIVNVASGAAFQPGPLMAVYFATKAYVLHFSEAVAEELSGTGVTITTLCPGPTQSNFWRAAGKESSFGFMGKMPSSSQVAEYGYQAMLRGDKVAIYGLTNRLGAFMVRFVPRSLAPKLIKWAQTK